MLTRCVVVAVASVVTFLLGPFDEWDSGPDPFIGRGFLLMLLGGAPGGVVVGLRTRSWWSGVLAGVVLTVGRPMAAFTALSMARMISGLDGLGKAASVSSHPTAPHAGGAATR